MKSFGNAFRRSSPLFRQRNYQRFEPRRFNVVVLDPPGWAKGPFGAIDIVRDYPGLLKPALLATAPGGGLLVTK